MLADLSQAAHSFSMTDFLRIGLQTLGTVIAIVGIMVPIYRGVIRELKTQIKSLGTDLSAMHDELPRR